MHEPFVRVRRGLLALALLAIAMAGHPEQASSHQESDLGRILFKEPRLSTDGRVSCATCHVPELGFMDGLPRSKGAHGREGTRNAPSLISIATQDAFSWDGRHVGLERQVVAPLADPQEHGLASVQHAVEILNADRSYRRRFQHVYGGPATPGNLARSLAAFVRSLEAPPSRGERYALSPSPDLLSVPERRGYELFMGGAGCAGCHKFDASGSVGDGAFHVLDIKRDPERADAVRRVAAMTASAREQAITRDTEVAGLGRFNVSLDPQDAGKFRTPSLRNVAETAPYMHDGSIATLEEAVDAELYYRNTRSPRPIFLTPQEKADLVAYLRTLTRESLR